MTDRYGEPDEPTEEDELPDDSDLSRLSPAARQHLDDARAALAEVRTTTRKRA